MKRILYFIFALSFALQAQEKSFDLLNALPQKTLAAVWCPSVDNVKTAFLQSDLYQLYQEEEIQQFLAPIFDRFGPEIQHEIAKELGKINRQTGSNVTLDTLLGAVKGQVTLAVTSVNPRNRRMPVNFAAAIEFSEEVRSIIERLTGGQSQEQKLQNVVVRRGPMPGCYVFEGNTLVYASSTELMDQLYGEKQGLRHSEQFANVCKRVTPEGEVTAFACFLNTKEAWNFAKQAIPPHVDGMLERVSVYSLESIAFSSNFSGRNIHSYGFLHLPGGKEGFFKLFPQTKVDVVESAKKFPDTAMGFSCGNMNFSGFMQEVENILRLLDPKGQMGFMQQYEQGLQMLKENMNLDLRLFANALQGVVAQASILPRRGLLPSSVAVYTVGDQNSLQNSLQSMASLLQLQIKSVERDGYTLNYLSAPLGELGTNPFDPRAMGRNPMQIFMRSFATAFSGMAYIIHDGHWYFSDSAQALQRYMAWKKDAKNTLADSADFQESMQSLSEDSTGVLYLNQKTLLARWWNSAIPFIRIFEGLLKKEKIPFHSALLPSHETITRHLGRAVFEFGNSEDGLFLAHKGQLEVVLGGVAIVGIGAAMLIPAMSKVSEKAKQTKCKANLNQIGKAVSIFMLDYGRSTVMPPPDKVQFITALFRSKILVEPEVFVCPSTGDRTSARDLESCGHNCTSYEALDIALLSTWKDTTTTPIVWDKYGNHQGLRNVLFLDGHVDHVSEWRFQEMLKETYARNAEGQEEMMELYRNKYSSGSLRYFWDQPKKDSKKYEKKK